ncbi:MAG: ATPase [Desulfurococcales archaeon]|nr:ATPase [Desulfurococcales archaeon]
MPVRMLPTGNEEFDLKLGGGLVYPALIVIEGEHGTGKTAIALQFLQGALRAGLRSVVFTSETRSSDYVLKAESSGFPITDYYIRGLLRVYSIQYPGDLTRDTANMLTVRLTRALHRLQADTDLVVIDSVSYFGSVASEPLLNRLIYTLRSMTMSGVGVIVTVHKDSLPPIATTELKASADGYLRLSPAVIGGRRLKVLSVVKLRGAPPGIESTISFDVDPAFGIKIVPIMVSQA